MGAKKNGSQKKREPSRTDFTPETVGSVAYKAKPTAISHELMMRSLFQRFKATVSSSTSSSEKRKLGKRKWFSSTY